MKLYYNPISGYSLKVLLALAEKDIPFEREVVNLMDPEARQAYREVYPIGKVPFLLLDDDHHIPESTTIIEYLDQEHALGLIPSDPTHARQARFHDRMSDFYIHNQMGTIFCDGMKPEDKRNPDGVQEAKRLIDIAYRALNAHLADHDYLVHNQYSLADLSLYAALFHAPHTYPYAEHANIVAFVERVSARPATQKVMQEVEPAVLAFKDSMG